MKNKFKKSKIIVPALALITATTVASVTGTVAWFTASRVATVNSSFFESQTLNSNMKVKTTALVGTKDATTTAAETASITVNGKLTHGSYNAQKITSDNDNAQGHLYVARVNGDLNPAVVTAYDDYGTEKAAETNGTALTVESHSKWAASVGTAADSNVWYAVAWSMEFSVTNSSTLAENSALFFDPTSTEFTDAETSGKTIQGLRIALMTSENYVVVGGLATNGTESEKHVVSSWDGKQGSASDHVGSFNASGQTAHYFKYGDTLATANDDVENTLKAHAGYLGKLANNKITVTAVAWFEGEDSSVITTSTMSKVTASLKFYSRNIKTTA